jgi:dTDP-4-amino-4,6-dideoxygalactose transaminase
VYGNACDIDAIQQIADRHGLKIIYDAAHCFGSLYKGRSVFEYGDVSTTSFHATKLFHTIEGGAVFTPHEKVYNTMSYMRNFGHDGPEAFAEVGVNGKNSEFHAAMGLVNLNYIEKILDSRKAQVKLYDEKLKGFPIRKPKILTEAIPNNSYYPVVFETEEALIKAVKRLNTHWVYPRRYFYPSLSTLHYVNTQLTPISEDLSRRVLCLPIFYSLSVEEQDMIVNILLKSKI